MVHHYQASPLPLFLCVTANAQVSLELYQCRTAIYSMSKVSAILPIVISQ